MVNSIAVPTALLLSLAIGPGALALLSRQQSTPARPGQGVGPGSAASAPDPSKAQRLEVSDGTKARYKVQEQLAGINFPSEAVGTTEAITGAIIVNPDGTFAPSSRLTVDLRTLKSDQSMRDGFVQGNILETEKFPTLTLVPKRAVGLPNPLPAGMQAQAGFQIVSDTTVHGVTKEITWNVVATFANDSVAGRATSTIDFATFNLTKPTLARLLSVDDKIALEIEFRCKRTGA